MADLRRLIVEIHRRSLWQVLVIYLVGAWVAYDVILALTEGGILPSWFPGVAVGAFLIGFPVVLASAVVQESTGQGAYAPAPAPRPRLLGRTGMLAGVILFVVSALAAGTLLFNSRAPPSLEAGTSVAVLPFANLSPDSSNQYFSDGLSEELLSELSRVPGLQVAARTSSFALKQLEIDVPEAGRRLGVAYLIEGSVRKAGERVRITVRLVRSDDGFRVWSQTFEQELGDIFQAQAEIAASVAAALRLRMDSSAIPDATSSAVAHDLFLRGLAEWNRRTAGSIYRAIDLFEEATKEDPSYARAFAGLALAAILVPQYDGDAPVAPYIDRARAAAERAVQLDPELAEAYAALGEIAWRFDYEPATAEELFGRAVARNPSYATAHQWHGELLLAQGRFIESAETLNRAVRLDPLSLPINALYGLALFRVGEVEGALEQVERALKMDPHFTTAHWVRLGIHLALDQPGNAADDAVRMLEAFPRATQEEARAVGEAVRLGVPTPAVREALAAWERRGLVLARDAALRAAIGDFEAALDLLEAGLQKRVASLPFDLTLPVMDPLREEPRFRRILRATQLES